MSTSPLRRATTWPPRRSRTISAGELTLRGRSRSLLRIRMSVPPSPRSTFTSSMRSSMMRSPRPRCSPRFSRQLPVSRTLAVSSPASNSTSTS